MEEELMKRVYIRTFSFADELPYPSKFFVIDARDLPDPRSVEELKGLDGRSDRVITWMRNNDGRNFLRNRFAYCEDEIKKRMKKVTPKENKVCIEIGDATGTWQAVAFARMLRDKMMDDASFERLRPFEVSLRHAKFPEET